MEHIRSKHLEIKIACGICMKKFSSKSVQTRHVKKVHGITNLANISNNETLAAPPLIELSYKAHEAFPHMAQTIGLKDSKKFERHIVATQDLVVGDVVMAAPPFAFIEYLENTSECCFECGMVSSNKIK